MAAISITTVTGVPCSFVGVTTATTGRLVFAYFSLQMWLWPKGDRACLSRSMKAYPAPWNEQTFFAAAGHDGTDPRDMALARTIIELAKERKWGPIWLVNPKPIFTVGTPQFFKVDSRGRIGFPFSRLGAGVAFGELADRLNGVVPTLRVQPTDFGTKSKGGQLSNLFKSEEHIREFFAVWSWFSTRA